jgi:hypothetical protein
MPKTISDSSAPNHKVVVKTRLRNAASRGANCEADGETDWEGVPDDLDGVRAGLPVNEGWGGAGRLKVLINDTTATSGLVRYS